jgi:hypothetical protein
VRIQFGQHRFAIHADKAAHDVAHRAEPFQFL